MPRSDATILIVGGMVYDQDGDTNRPARSDILIVDGCIEAVGPDLASGSDVANAIDAGTRPTVFGRPVDTVIDARDRLVLPGLINAHYHSHDALMKGCFETIPRETWLLNALPPNYPRRSRAELRARTLLGAVECLRAGITTVQDMLTLAPMDADDIEVILAAYAEAGIRCVFSLQIGDVHGAKVTPFWEQLLPKEMLGGLSGVVAIEAGGALVKGIQALHARFDQRHATVSWGLAPSSPERCSPALLRALAKWSDEAGIPVFTHIYESRATTLIARQKFAAWDGSLVKYLAAHGLLGPNTTLAHGVWMQPSEIRLIADAGASVVLNPVSNLKTRSGVAPIGQYVEAGVHLGLGCDNSSCSDAQNLFQVMKAFAGLSAVSNVTAERPSASDALFAATAGGARAVGLGGRIGRIAQGYRADLTLLDLNELAFIPFNSAARQVVFSESGSSVDTVIVDGRIVVRDGKVITVDVGALRRDIEGLMDGLREDIAAVGARTEALRSQLTEAHRRTWESSLEVNRYVSAMPAE
jgi:guanine deaminase